MAIRLSNVEMPGKYTRTQSKALAVVALCGIGISFVSIWLLGQLQSANWWMNHPLRVVDEANQTLICVADCETAWRSYVLSGDRASLEPWTISRGKVFSHIRRLRELTADNPRQSQTMPRLEKYASEKILFGAQTIARKNADPNGAPSLVQDLRRGNALMQNIRWVLNEIQDEEQSLYVQRERSVARLQSMTYAWVGLLGAIMVSSLVWLAKSTREFAAEQEKARAVIMEARDVALQASELKSQFVANISHELRTPLAGVLGMSELLGRTELAPDMREMTDHIYRSAQGLLVIVNDLLDFSKLEAGKMELERIEFRLPELVDDVVRSVQVAADAKNLKLEVHLSDSLADRAFLGDPLRLKQILLNLLGNATKFTAAGSIKLSVVEAAEDDAKRLIMFSVCDTGIGLMPEEQKKLFCPFVQADGSTTRKFGGTGLGLSISRKLVEIMDGEIGCSSDGPGLGAIFWFKLPLESYSVKSTEAR